MVSIFIEYCSIKKAQCILGYEPEVIMSPSSSDGDNNNELLCNDRDDNNDQSPQQ